MAQADVIKEFLVSLGFKVDSASYNKFNNAVTGSTGLAEGLGKTAAAAVLSTTAAVAAVSSAMDKLYFVSQRTGSSVSDIKAFNFAVSQTGGSADSAQQSLENLGRFIRFTPGAGKFLENLGVSPENVGDASKALVDLQKAFQGMSPYLQKAYGDILGIDEKTLLSLTSGELNKGINEYNHRLKDAGVNADIAAEKGKEFMKSLRGVGAAADVAGTAMVENFGGPLTEVLKGIDVWLTIIGKTIASPGAIADGLSLMVSDPAKWLDNYNKNFPGYVAPKSAAKSGTLADQVQSSAFSLSGSEGIMLPIPSTDASLFEDARDYKLFSDGGSKGGQKIVVQQDVNIQVNGAGNPEAVGASVARHQNNAMQNAYRLGKVQ